MDAIDGGFDLGIIKPENMRPQMESDTAKEMADYLMTRWNTRRQASSIWPGTSAFGCLLKVAAP